ncbi:hypothetical protein [Niameybacter sp.]|uniref:hypothetical protein n=1 Tax=Niameybacter sp. TaxID=2033640 RepID=UPI002FCC7AD0
MNLYDRLIKLQEIEHAFSEWEAYRHQVTEFIIKDTSPEHTLAICGAGRCNDLDLERLTKHFKQVILVDKDVPSMEAARYRYNLEKDSNLKMQVADFVGIGDDAYRDYVDTLIEAVRKKGIQTDLEDLVKLALKQLQSLEGQILTTPVELGIASCDVIVALGVHSQLLNMLEWIWTIVLETIRQEEVSVRDKIKMMNRLAIEKFNDTLFRHAKKQLVMGFEVGRAGQEGSIQGAIQGLEDMSHYEASGEVQGVDTLEVQWPFDEKQNKMYYMQIKKFSLGRD